MKILFDESVPRPLKRFFVGDDVSTVQELGWSGIGNGDLVDRADADFEVLVLADKNLRYQQNLQSRTIAIVELPTNRWPLLAQMVDRVVAATRAVSPGSYLLLTL